MLSASCGGSSKLSQPNPPWRIDSSDAFVTLSVRIKYDGLITTPSIDEGSSGTFSFICARTRARHSICSSSSCAVKDMDSLPMDKVIVSSGFNFDLSIIDSPFPLPPLLPLPYYLPRCRKSCSSMNARVQAMDILCDDCFMRLFSLH